MKVKVIVTLTIYFGIVLNLVVAYLPSTCTRCKSVHSCKPPECVCCSNEMPLTYKETPQMVFFTFDDAITPQVAGFYRQLFDSSRRNPNGCPVSMTLFISHSNTVYSLVREFYQKGMEIASHSVSHGHPKASTFKNEANKQKQNLARMARIPHTRIKGWRSPFLEPLGDAQPNMLQELGYSYDATLTISKKSLGENPPVPFTLDYGWPYDCKIKPCPKQSHRGFWEVPVISLMDYLQRFDCVYVDGCNNPPPDEEAAYRFLWDNFQSYYKTNKAPFGINMHASWFFYPDRLKAMDRFIHDLVMLKDVYIVSVKQVIDWLRNPVKLEDVKHFEPWGCSKFNNSNSATKSAFDLRNTQIQQRLKELRQKQFQKQEMEFLQKHHVWEMQQAAKKAAKYSKTNNEILANEQRPRIMQYNQMLRPRSRTSSAMTWQQMLVAHARITHAKLQGLRNPKPGTVQNIQGDTSFNRMVRPVGQSDPKQKEMMLKEQKRIREQQRIAAENRMKEKERLQTQTPVSKEIATHSHVKEVIETKSPVQQTVQKPPVNRDQKDNNPSKSYPMIIQSKVEQVQHSPSPVQHSSRSNIHSVRPTQKVTIRRPSSPTDSKVQLQQISNPQHHINIRPQVSRSNTHDNNVIYRHLPSGQNSAPTKAVTIVSRPIIKESIQEPVQKQRIKQKIELSRQETETDRKPTGVQSLINNSQQKTETIPRTAPIKLVGRSWNLFNMKPGEMKLPWQNWFAKDIKSKTDDNHTERNMNGQGLQSHQRVTKPKIDVKQTMDDKKPNSHILFSTNSIEKLRTFTTKPIILSNENNTVGAVVAKSDIKRTQNEQVLYKSDSKCQQHVNCFSPKCFCLTHNNPFKMKTKDIPQIVYITIEGELNFLSYSKMRSLFKSQRVNPNGCPISSTFFISEQGTSYTLARNLQRYGTEIAMNGRKKNEYTDINSMKTDIESQMEDIAKHVGSSGESSIGWRSPGLKVLGDEQFGLFENKSIYDSSIILDRSSKVWPFTLDFGLDNHCLDMKSCQFQKHPGVFEVPVIPLFGYNQSEPCTHIDDCSNQPKTVEETYQYILKNFEKYYHNNRAPFGLHLSQKWFHWSYSRNLAGLSKFIDKILEYDDVYIVKISEMLNWMKQPTQISDISKSKLWNC